MLLALEPLPRDPAEPSRRGPGWLRMLLAPEPLPRDPARTPPPGRSRWLRWLFALEPLDPP